MTKLQHLRPFLSRSSRYYRFMSSSHKEGDDKCKTPSKDANEKSSNRPMYVPDGSLTMDDIEEPTNCCMSGCPNCVWIEYAEKLSTVLKNSPGDVQKVLMEKVQDPNMRAFLSMELRTRKIIE